MCVDPVTMTLAATALSAIGTGISTVSAVQQANYEARVADRNAELERSAARDALERGRIADRRHQQEAAQLMGRQNAALAANGIDIGYGSAAAIRGDTAALAQEDAQTIRENAMREVRGLEINAMNYTAQARASRQSAVGTAIAGAFQVGSTILGGAQQYKRTQTGRRMSSSSFG